MLARFRPYGPLLLILFAASCFDYAAAPREHLVAGRDVRITLTSEARTTLASKLGTQVKWVSGRLQTVDTSGVTIAIARTTLVDNTDASWNGELVAIPANDIAEVEQRKIATSKTVVLVALVTGVAVAVALAVGLSTSSAQNGSQSGGAK
jgi:hypothetical protein